MAPQRERPVHPITPPKPVPPPTDVPTRPTPPGNPVGIVLCVALALAACGQQADEAETDTAATGPSASHPAAAMVRAEVAEAVMILSSAREPALRHYRATGAWPSAAQLAQAVPIRSGTYTKNLRAGPGLSLAVDYKGMSQGVVRMLYEAASGTWLCRAEGLADTMLPPNCR